MCNLSQVEKICIWLKSLYFLQNLANVGPFLNLTICNSIFILILETFCVLSHSLHKELWIFSLCILHLLIMFVMFTHGRKYIKHTFNRINILNVLLSSKFYIFVPTIFSTDWDYNILYALFCFCLVYILSFYLIC